MKSLLRNTLKDLLQSTIYPGRFLWRLPPASANLALTFDDGPDPEWTPRMLDMLAEQEAQATFFLVGRAVRRHPGLVRRIVGEGHAVGGHSDDHTVITTQSSAALREDLARCRAAIADAAGVDSILFRPPKGEVNLRSIRTVCGAGYRLVHWSRTFSDYRRDGTDALSSRIAAVGASAGDILLFHDNNPYTAQALAATLPRWKSQSLGFVPLPHS